MVTGRLLAVFGSRPVMAITLIGYCVAAPSVGLAGSGGQLFAALLVWGAFQGSLDVAMNTQAVAVEQALGRPAMSGFHCAWSVGGLLGAGLGAAVVGFGGDLALQLVALAAAVAVGGSIAIGRLLPDPPPEPAVTVEAGTSARGALRTPAVLVLGGMALACMFCEGAVADWSAVHLRDALGSSAAVAGLAYAGFSAVMVVFRFTGDRLMVRFPPQTSVPVLASIATVAFAVALAIGSVPAALFGWAALGAGLALIIPAALSAAGRLPGVPPGTAVATVAGLGWAGYVGGPPLIGVLSEATSLPTTLVLVPVLTAIVAVTARTSGVLRVSP